MSAIPLPLPLPLGDPTVGSRFAGSMTWIWSRWSDSGVHGGKKPDRSALDTGDALAVADGSEAGAPASSRTAARDEERGSGCGISESGAPQSTHSTIAMAIVALRMPIRMAGASS
jgi:hypothetical protein